MNCEVARATKVTSVSPADVLNTVGGMLKGGWHYCYSIDVLKSRILSHPDSDSHYVDADGVRHWIPSAAIYYCLMGRAVPAETVRWRDYITRTPEAAWATCSN